MRANQSSNKSSFTKSKQKTSYLNAFRKVFPKSTHENIQSKSVQNKNNHSNVITKLVMTNKNELVNIIEVKQDFLEPSVQITEMPNSNLMSY